MNQKMKALRIVIVVGSLLTLLPFAALASAINHPHIGPATKYLLSGRLADSDSDWDYYLLDGGASYAVSLKTSAWTTSSSGQTVTRSSITVPSTHPVHTDKKVTGIWHGGFYQCPIPEINLTNNITVIDYEAFLGSAITSIRIPYTVTDIGDAAFYGCTSLLSAYFANSSAGATGSALTCSCEGTSAGTIYYSKLTTIPAFCFFDCTSLTEVSFPATLKNIEFEAFNGCAALASPLYFKSIEKIRSRAFQGCKSLNVVYISSSLFTDPNNSGIEPHAFNYCDTMHFTFCASETAINAWLAVGDHKYWGWHNDRGDPNSMSDTATILNSENCYTYEVNENTTVQYTEDWTYTITSLDPKEATVNSYNGGTPVSNHYFVIPDEIDGYTITRVDKTVFTPETKAKITRLYLPQTLVAIENEMFDGNYDNLTVIDTNDHCTDDEGNESPTKRICLQSMTELKYIGYRAFPLMDKIAEIEKVHLPAKLISIGDEAFYCSEGDRQMKKAGEFYWNYVEGQSCLETIGDYAFYKMGWNDGKFVSTRSYTSTVIFPKKFKYFGVLKSDHDRYLANDGFDMGQKSNYDGSGYGAYAFALCPLLRYVVFKGGANSEDLIIPMGTFYKNHSLQKIVFEERYGETNASPKTITFHTRNGNTITPAIGGSSGRDSNDFRGDPAIQTIVLPNKYTKLRFQHFALQANSRAVLYFTGGETSSGNNIPANTVGDNTLHDWRDFINNDVGETISDATIKCWRKIGDENFYQGSGDTKGYIGYRFTSSGSDLGSGFKNSFGLDQNMPCYYNVHYSDTVTVAGAVITNISVESGISAANGVGDYIEKGKCAFVATSANTATMTKYLYDQRNEDNSVETVSNYKTTLKVPATVGNNNQYSVTIIGDSAFSAAFCDAKNDGTPKTSGKWRDLCIVQIPSTIESIGNYAFLRAYGVKELTSYDASSGAVSASYTMPSGLTSVGKNAFSFCNIAQFLGFNTNCLFYENVNQDGNKVTSCFTNNFSLRKITFDTEKQTESNKYETTTYQTTVGQDTVTYTSALYSRSTKTQANRLLLVLNRNYGDYNKGSDDCDVTGMFNGKRKSNPFLFGAYKMGYWIRKLVLGAATKDTSKNLIPQAFFSGICTRTISGNPATETLGDDYVYLWQTKNTYASLPCDLTTLLGDVLNSPDYAFDGCENLKDVYLGKGSGSITNGIFKDVDNPDLKYHTVDFSNAADLIGSEEDGVLDFSASGYNVTTIGSNAFKNNKAITAFIAPSTTADFTINESAFEGCENLDFVDLSGLKGKVTLKQNCFKDSGVSRVEWPDDNPVYNEAGYDTTTNTPKFVADGWAVTVGNLSNAIIINDGAFLNCDSITSLVLPSRLTILGNTYGDNKTPANTTGGAFQGCDNLESVTFAGGENEVLLRIGAKSFSGCGKLDYFAFDQLRFGYEINCNAFEDTGTLSPDGKVVLGKSFSTLRASAFPGSHLTSIEFKKALPNEPTVPFDSMSPEGKRSLSIKANSFKGCTNLVSFRAQPTSPMDQPGAASVFEGCSNLKELILSENFDTKTEKKGYLKNCSEITKRDGETVLYSGLFLYRKYAKRETVHGEFVKIATGKSAQACYYVETIADVLVNGNGNPANDAWFWTKDGAGNAIYLGKASGTNSEVVFDSGHQLTDSGFSKTITTQGQCYANGTLINNETVYTMGGVLLGTSDSYDSATGTVLFSEGYRVDADGHVYIKVTTSQSDKLYNGVDDLVDGASGKYYWYDDDGSVVLLGNGSSYSAGVATFESGGNTTYTLDSSGNLARTITSYTQLLQEDADGLISTSTAYTIGGTSLGHATKYVAGVGVIFDSGYLLEEANSVVVYTIIADATDLSSLSTSIDYWCYDGDGITPVLLGKPGNGYYDSASGTALFSGNIRVDGDGILYYLASKAGLVNDGLLISGATSRYYWYDNGGAVLLIGHAVSYEPGSGTVLFDGDYRLDGSHLYTLIDGETNLSGLSASTYYWWNDNGSVVLLGTCDSYTAGTATFSAGYTINSGNLARTITSYSELVQEDADGLVSTSTVYTKGGTVLGTAVSYHEGIGVVFSNGYLVDTDGNIHTRILGGAISSLDSGTRYWAMNGNGVPVLLGFGSDGTYDSTSATVKFTVSDIDYRVDANGHLLLKIQNLEEWLLVAAFSPEQRANTYFYYENPDNNAIICLGTALKFSAANAKVEFSEGYYFGAVGGVQS